MVKLLIYFTDLAIQISYEAATWDLQFLSHPVVRTLNTCEETLRPHFTVFHTHCSC